MKPDIKKFLKDPHARNVWLTAPTMSVYVRKGRHYINGQSRSCFDVANIEVPLELQRQGIFTRWLAEVEAHIATTDIEGIFVESILQLGLIPFLARNGYVSVERSNPPSMFKLTIPGKVV